MAESYYEEDADWRRPFANYSAATWEQEAGRLLSTRLDNEALLAARSLRDAWRSDCTSAAAQRLEGGAAAEFADLMTEDLIRPSADPLPEVELGALRAMIGITQQQLREVGLDQIRVFRGLRMTVRYHDGDIVESVGRALSSWTADPAVAEAYAARVPSDFGYVLRVDVPVDRVAMLFDPSSDGEVVVIGDVISTVATVIP